jgi:hypothetical protein
MPIELIQGPNGKVIPAQRIRSLYSLVLALDPPGEPRLQKVPLEVGAEHFVSHFETCPEADHFSRSSKR